MRYQSDQHRKHLCFRPTIQGLLAIGICICIILIAAMKQDIVFWYASICMLAVILSALVLGFINYLTLKRCLANTRDQNNTDLITTQTFSTFQVLIHGPRLGRWLFPLFRFELLQRHHQSSSLPPTLDSTSEIIIDTRTLTLPIIAIRRGSFSGISGLISCTDILHCFCWHMRWHVANRLHIAPGELNDNTTHQHAKVLGDVLHDPLSRTHGDLVDMRAYRPGDPPRLVLWKHYGKHRQLFVRQAETSEQEENERRIVLVTSPTDQGAAALACGLMNPHHALFRDTKFTLVIWGEQHLQPARDDLIRSSIDRLVNSSKISTTIGVPEKGDIILCDSSTASQLRENMSASGHQNIVIDIDNSSLNIGPA